MIRVFGITGTNGKTTASWMLKSILEQRGPCGLIGTIEYRIKDKKYEPPNTTPGKELLRRLFSEMQQMDVRQCVMEVSSHGIHQGRIDEVLFAGTGFTNLSRDHLDYHGDMEEYYQTKKKLFCKSFSKCTVNIDDPYGNRLYGELISEKCTSLIKGCSLEMPDTDFYGKIVNISLDGTEMELYVQGEYAGVLDIKLPGRAFAEDALIASAMAMQEGISFKSVREGLLKAGHVPGRMEIVGNSGETTGIVDYAHTPDGLENLLSTVKGLCRGKIITVFGCGGFRDSGKRIVMGDIAGRYSDYCIITNDNPRGEPPENIAQAIEEGVHPTGCEYCIIFDRYQAIKRAVSLADKWDIIVVAGKGHETYQLSGDKLVPFEDKKVLKELLEKKYERTYNEPDCSRNGRTPSLR